MKLTINTPAIARHTGYGRAASELIEALQRQDVHLTDDADVVINFCMPKDYIFRDYTVGYTPWESTKLPHGWAETMLKVDDLWTTSTWTASIFKYEILRDAWVLPHGLNPTWLPVHHERQDNRPFTFLHVGEPAVRKGGDLVLDAWYRAYKDSSCRLIIKSTGVPMGRVKDRSGSIVYSPPMMTNGEVRNQVYSDLEMWRLYCEVDVLVYPSRGEGFGLIPLEAMASGLPTILPEGGGTADFVNYGTPLHKFMWSTSNQEEHPGLWMDHDVDEIIERMRAIHRHYREHANRAYIQAQHIHDKYNWDEIAKNLMIRVADGIGAAL